jgi:hypothetical protein
MLRLAVRQVRVKNMKNKPNLELSLCRVEQCEDSPCLNGALCLVEEDLFRCYCVPDYHGKRCQFKYNECQLPPGKRMILCREIRALVQDCKQSLEEPPILRNLRSGGIDFIVLKK